MVRDRIDQVSRLRNPSAAHDPIAELHRTVDTCVVVRPAGVAVRRSRVSKAAVARGRETISPGLAEGETLSPRYRLCHDALGQALSRGRDIDTDAQRPDRLAPAPPGATNQPWANAPGYLRGHAAVMPRPPANLLPLAKDAEFLSVADFARLPP